MTRADWDVALHHEDARFVRYGRPATVLVIELRAVAPEVLDRLGPRVGSIIREHARETDLVARVSRDRFHVLLPETLDADAAAFFERVTTATDALFGSDADRPLTIVGAAVTPARGGTLAEALRRAGDGLVSADQGRDEVVEFGGGVVRDPGVDR